MGKGAGALTARQRAFNAGKIVRIHGALWVAGCVLCAPGVKVPADATGSGGCQCGWILCLPSCHVSVNMTDGTLPPLQGPTSKERKYDRQLRLWAANGQAALEEANLLLLNSGSGVVGVETLKNLVLPGMAQWATQKIIC